MSVQPRTLWVPPNAVTSAGAEAVDLAAEAGLILDAWQAEIIHAMLGIRPDGKWNAWEFGIEVSRQNGKGSIIEARELAALFIVHDRLTIHSAHLFDTSLEAFNRLLFLVENTAYLSARVKRVSKSHGEEGIELMSGERIRFRTRTKGGGRGFTGDCLVLDEAMIIPTMAHGALLPTLSARPNPQVLYCGSAVDQHVHPDGLVFARLRRRAQRQDDPSMAYFGFGADAEHPDQVTPEMAGDPDVWKQANPALGIRIRPEHVAAERLSMDPRTFAVERLGVGDWPNPEDDGSVFDLKEWRALTDTSSAIAGPTHWAIDMPLSRTSASIMVAGMRKDGRGHVELVDRREGTGWVEARLVDLVARHGIDKVLVGSDSPAASLVGTLEGVEFEIVTAQDYARACGAFYDAVVNKELRHLGSAALESAVRGAARATSGAWHRKQSTTDIAPLVAASLALHRARTHAGEPEIMVMFA